MIKLNTSESMLMAPTKIMNINIDFQEGGEKYKMNKYKYFNGRLFNY